MKINTLSKRARMNVSFFTSISVGSEQSAHAASHACPKVRVTKYSMLTKQLAALLKSSHEQTTPGSQFDYLPNLALKSHIMYCNQRLCRLASTDRRTTSLNKLEKRGFQQKNKEIALLLCSFLQLNWHYERLSFLLAGDGVDLATVATSWQQLPLNKFPM